MSVLLNNGDGTCAAKSDYAVGNALHSIFVMDMDGNGANDLAVANRLSNNVTVLLNPFPSVSIPELAGDFDGDNEVGLSDFVRFLDVFGATPSSPDWESAYDLDSDGEIGLSDFVIFLDNFGSTE